MRYPADPYRTGSCSRPTLHREEPPYGYHVVNVTAAQFGRREALEGPTRSRRRRCRGPGAGHSRARRGRRVLAPSCSSGGAWRSRRPRAERLPPLLHAGRRCRFPPHSNARSLFIASPQVFGNRDMLNPARRPGRQSGHYRAYLTQSRPHIAGLTVAWQSPLTAPVDRSPRSEPLPEPPHKSRLPRKDIDQACKATFATKSVFAVTTRSC